MQMKRTVICLLSMLLPLLMLAGNDRYINRIYEEYGKMETDSLLVYAYRDILNEKYDQATAIYALALTRLENSNEKADLKKVARIYNNIGYINSFEYYNFAEAYKYYIRSMEISRQIHYTDLYATLQLNIGNIYAELNLYEKSQDYFLHAFNDGIRYRQPEPTLIAFVNLLSHALEYNDLESTRKIAGRYADIPDSGQASLSRFTALYHKGVMYLLDKRYPQALETFAQLQSNVDTDFDPERYVLMSYTATTATYRIMGEYDKAITEALRARSYANEQGFHNASMWINLMLEKLYDLAGRHEEALAAKRDALFMKDSLMNDKTISSIFEIKSSHDVDNLRHQIAEINQKRRNQNIVTGILLTASLVIFLLLLWLYIKNRRLRNYNQELYRKNMEAIRTEQQNTRLRKSYEHKLAECMEELDKLKQETASQETEENSNTKYRNSPLDDLSKETLLGRILDVMENSREVFSQDFSLDKLTALVGSRSKYVSQIINETYEKNFSAFLAERRIREACQILSDESLMKNYTIEAIAANLGFKSRTNFISVFKRVTGLTPTQFKNHIE